MGSNTLMGSNALQAIPSQTTKEFKIDLTLKLYIHKQKW